MIALDVSLRADDLPPQSRHGADVALPTLAATSSTRPSGTKQ
jgi:hypothetical protein